MQAHPSQKPVTIFSINAYNKLFLMRCKIQDPHKHFSLSIPFFLLEIRKGSNLKPYTHVQSNLPFPINATHLKQHNKPFGTIFYIYTEEPRFTLPYEPILMGRCTYQMSNNFDFHFSYFFSIYHP